MSQGVLEFTGVKYDSKSQMEKPHFRKKDGGEWALAPGSVDFRQFQPGKLFIVWDNWTVQSATTNIPAGGGSKGGSWKAQPYHKEQFVSNVVGSCIQAGLIKQPADLGQWVAEAWKQIGLCQGQVQNPTPSQPSQRPQVDERNPPDFDDSIPF